MHMIHFGHTKNTLGPWALINLGKRSGLEGRMLLSLKITSEGCQFENTGSCAGSP